MHLVLNILIPNIISILLHKIAFDTYLNFGEVKEYIFSIFNISISNISFIMLIY